MTRPAAWLPAALGLALLLLLHEAQFAAAEDPADPDDPPETEATVAESPESHESQNKSKKAYFESFGNVTTEIKEVSRDVVRKVWEWLFGKASEAETHRGLNLGDGSDGEGNEGERGPLLASFCGMDVGEEKTVDCSCCADHLLGSQVEASAMLYGGHASEEAPAFHRNDSDHAGRSGRVRVWSLGSFVPSIWCDRGQPVCRCEDPIQAWHVSEPACRAGGACVPPVEPEELSSEPLNDTAPRAPPGTAGCAGETSTRIPIGSARCEDMSVRQCAQLYARGESGWHYCEVDNKAVRTCGAKLSEGNQLKQDADERTKMWAVQLAYSPDLNWTVVEREDHTFRVSGEPMPPTEEVRAILRKWGQSPPPPKQQEAS